jgi:hypothetical protein
MIKTKLGVGGIDVVPYKHGHMVQWRCAAANDLAEVIVPIFDRYPLRTGKFREYKIWRQAVLRKYEITIGGTINRVFQTEGDIKMFSTCVKMIRKIRSERKP